MRILTTMAAILVLSGLVLSGLLISGASAAEKMNGMNHDGMDMGKGDSPFEAVNHAMHEAMDIEFTGDIDQDFMRSMIPHHEGAVAMAKIALERGADPEVRKLAEAIVKTQSEEIRQIKAWLEKHPQP